MRVSVNHQILNPLQTVVLTNRFDHNLIAFLSLNNTKVTHYFYGYKMNLVTYVIRGINV